MRMELLEDLYTQGLAQLYDGEKQLIRIFPKIARAMSTEELGQLFEHHLEETKQQAKRLEQLLARRGEWQAKKAKAMGGLLAETKELLKQKETDPQLLDAALVSAAQKIEAHEIASYGCVHNFARLLGLHTDLRPLEDSFHEEERMEEKLAGLAESLNVEEIEAEAEIEPARAPS